MSGIDSYATTLLIYALVDIVAVLALNVQFGMAGVLNFAFIAYVAVGAYAYALLTLGSPTANGGFQHFFAGTQLPFPLPFVLAAAAGCVAGMVSGVLLLRRLRPDFQALAFFALSFVASGLATSLPHFLNGSAGLSLIPAPLASTLGWSPYGNRYAWFYVGLALVLTVLCFWLAQRLTSSPWGRLLRALKDNERACSALGKSPGLTRYVAFITGCGLSALSGALLAAFLSAWGPAAWTFPETIVFFTAVIVGGTANNWGVSLGAVLVGVVISQAPLFLPSFASGQTVAAVQWIAIAGLVLGFVWFKPQGLLPERIRRYSSDDSLSPSEPHVKSADQTPFQPEAEVVARTPRPDAEAHRSAEALCVENLARDFGGVHAVAGVSFSIPVGSITGLMGPNGAGKSTLVSMIAGEMRPTSGRLVYLGQDVTRHNAGWLGRHGLIRTFQISSEFRSLSVLENLLVGQQKHPGERFLPALAHRRRWRPTEAEALERAWSLLSQFGLASLANERAGALSGGQRRLVELMRAMMAEPKVLLLDEPVAGIVRATSDMFLDTLLELRDRGLTILLVEHELRALHRVSDNVIVMARGRKLAEGSMADLAASQEVIQAYVAG
jgi:ABC-type branched-subunit amino acid transport system ATPase component/ABC-type branched-subunit amino acid transport system permease subunit